MLTSVLRLSCPHCGKRVRVDARHAGKIAQCPGCGTDFTIPVEVTPDERCEPEPVVISDDSITRECDFCGETILAKAKKCKHCGELLDPVLRLALGASEQVKGTIPSDSEVMIQHMQLKKSHA